MVALQSCAYPSRWVATRANDDLLRFSQLRALLETLIASYNGQARHSSPKLVSDVVWGSVKEMRRSQSLRPTLLETQSLLHKDVDLVNSGLSGSSSGDDLGSMNLPNGASRLVVQDRIPAKS